MARSTSYSQSIVRQQREIKRQQAAEARAQREKEKEQAKRYLGSRITEVEWKNKDIEQQITRLNNLLLEAVSSSVFSVFSLDSLKQSIPIFPPFSPGKLGAAEAPPSPSAYWVTSPTAMQKLLPGVKKKYENDVAQSASRYGIDVAAHRRREETRKRALHDAKIAYEQKAILAQQKIMLYETLKREWMTGNSKAIADYCTLVLETSDYPEGFPWSSKVAYVPESKQLVIEYDLPLLEVIPEVGSYKYVKTKDEITQTLRPATQRKALYSSVIAQIVLRALHELFRADYPKHLDSIVFNGYVDTVDQSTGRSVRPC